MIRYKVLLRDEDFGLIPTKSQPISAKNYTEFFDYTLRKKTKYEVEISTTQIYVFQNSSLKCLFQGPH